MTTETEQKCRDCAQDILLSVGADYGRGDGSLEEDIGYAAAKIAARVAEAIAGCEAQLAKDPIAQAMRPIVEENHDLREEVKQLRIALDLAHKSENKLTEEIFAYRDGGLTEEILRRNDGRLKVGNGVCFVVDSYLQELKEELDRANERIASLTHKE